jgi:hypothetical protein
MSRQPVSKTEPQRNAKERWIAFLSSIRPFGDEQFMRKFTCGLLLGRSVTPILLAIVIMCGWAPVHATTNPSHWEHYTQSRSCFNRSTSSNGAKPDYTDQQQLAITSEDLWDNCSG